MTHGPSTGRLDRAEPLADPARVRIPTVMQQPSHSWFGGHLRTMAVVCTVAIAAMGSFAAAGAAAGDLWVEGAVEDAKASAQRWNVSFGWVDRLYALGLLLVAALLIPPVPFAIIEAVAPPAGRRRGEVAVIVFVPLALVLGFLGSARFDLVEGLFAVEAWFFVNLLTFAALVGAFVGYLLFRAFCGVTTPDRT